ncbi:hypothetical protein ACYATM_04560 [Lactobacillaceae bacterium Scapto_B20]
MNKIEIPFLLSLRKGKFAPNETFTGLNGLAGVTFELSAVGKSNEELMQGPTDEDRLRFLVSGDDNDISDTEFPMNELFTTKIEFEWAKQKYQISFK